MAVAEPLVTVVVLNWNGAHLLGDCLRGLAAQDLPEGQLATWVVDNASTDGSLELLADQFPWVRAIANDSNDGFAGGNNLALREVATPFVALINNDARPEPDWLRRLLEPFSEPGAERLGAVSAKIVFLPRFLAVELATPGFVPGTLDTRELGVRVYRVTVDGEDVTERVLWDRVAYGPEGEGPGRFRWTRPAGMLLIPVDRDPAQERPLRLGLRVAAETTKAVELTWSGGSGSGKAEPEPVDLEVEVPAGVPLADVLNNAGSMVFRDGYGADRAYQELDRGQYQTARGGVRLLRGLGLLPHRGAAPGRGVRRRLLPLLRGHRPVVAAAVAGLADPVPAGGGGPPHPLGLLGRVVAAVRVPHRPQPAAHADQERPCQPGRPRGPALPADHRLPGPARGRQGPPHPPPPPGPPDPPAPAGPGLLCCACSRPCWPAAAASPPGPRSTASAWSAGWCCGEFGHNMTA